MTKNNEDFALEQKQEGGAVAVEQSRAIQEVQGAIVMAKKFPRDEKAAQARILEACKRMNLAKAAMYSYNRGDTQITAPTIRLAETLAKYWGNIQFGIVELSNQNGASEVMAYAWDLETNTRQIKQFSVKHVRYTKKGGSYKLTDPRDIYEVAANQGARRLRACILGVLPTDIIEAAVEKCEDVLEKDAAESLLERIKICVERFSEIGVSQDMIEKRIGHKVEVTNVHELIALGKIFNAIRDNMSSVDDYFEKVTAQAPEVTPEDSEAVNEAQKKLFDKKNKTEGK